MNRERAGSYRKNLSGDYEYQSFVPASLPPNPSIQYGEPLVRQLVNANKQLKPPSNARYATVLKAVWFSHESKGRSKEVLDKKTSIY